MTLKNAAKDLGGRNAKGPAVKHRSIVLAGAVALAALAISSVPQVGGSPVSAATPPPTPPPLPMTTTAPATPTPAPPLDIPTLTPVGATPAPSATKTPAPPKGVRKGIEGVWEIQIQRGAKTEYEHFQIVQTDNALTGFYLDQDKKKSPLAGSLDGKTVTIVVTFADGTTAKFTAQLDGTTDMLGLMETAKEQVPFTAAYRPKENFFDTISPGTGLGGPGGGYGPGR